MPDGDSLNWKVRGVGSQRVLALVRSGTEPGLVADAAVQMFAKQAHRGRWRPAMKEIADALDSSVRQISADTDFTKRAQIFHSFSQRLDSIARTHSDDGIAILQRGAERAFGTLEERSQVVDRQIIEEELLSQAAGALVDRRVLQPTRDEIARESQRDSSEQMCYEHELLAHIGNEAKRLHRSFFETTDPVAVRTPRRRVPKKATTIERLAEALPVYPGGNE